MLSNAGSGTDSQILGGINWAVENKCAVISMSLGARTRPGQTFSRVFEAVALRAQQAGTLILAAAGNDSNRPAVSPVSHPANCPSIMAVAALDSTGGVARFSNRGLNPDGGQIDIGAPGVDVLSSYPMPTRYRRLNGTSMATPHAAGVAALLAEVNPGARGAALGQLLTTRARRLAHLLRRRGVGPGAVALSEQEQSQQRPVEVSVLVAGEHLASIDAVAAALERAGVRVGEVMGSVGVITGIAYDPGRLAALQALDGVDSVEVGRTVQLPPPDSPIQ